MLATLFLCTQHPYHLLADFSLLCHSIRSLPVYPASLMSQMQLTVHGSWTTDNAGGNTNSPTFFKNPQYRLTIPGDKGWDMHIQAMFSKEVRAFLCPYLGQRCSQISASISVIDPKKNLNPKALSATSPSGVTKADGAPVGRIDSIASDAAEVMTSGNYRSPYRFNFFLSYDNTAQASVFVPLTASSLVTTWWSCQHMRLDPLDHLFLPSPLLVELPH